MFLNEISLPKNILDIMEKIAIDIAFATNMSVYNPMSVLNPKIDSRMNPNNSKYAFGIYKIGDLSKGKFHLFVEYHSPMTMTRDQYLEYGDLCERQMRVCIKLLNAILKTYNIEIIEKEKTPNHVLPRSIASGLNFRISRKDNAFK